MDFGEYKKELIKISKTIDACKVGYAQLLKSESWFDLCLIVRDSFEWCVNNNLITPAQEEKIPLVAGLKSRHVIR